MRTPLIDGLVKAGKQFKSPIMSPKDVSSAVVKQIVSQSGGQVIIPSNQSSASQLRGFPNWMQERFRNKGSLGLLKLRQMQMGLDSRGSATA